MTCVRRIEATAGPEPNAGGWSSGSDSDSESGTWLGFAFPDNPEDILSTFDIEAIDSQWAFPRTWVPDISAWLVTVEARESWRRAHLSEHH